MKNFKVIATVKDRVEYICFSVKAQSWGGAFDIVKSALGEGVDNYWISNSINNPHEPTPESMYNTSEDLRKMGIVRINRYNPT